jgi:hypothetical protein
MNGFSKFAGRAGLFPRLLVEEDLASVYRESIASVHNDKTFSSKPPYRGLSYEEFKRSLILLTIVVVKK